MLFLLFCALPLGLNGLIVFYLRSLRRTTERATEEEFRIPPSLPFETEPNRPPLPYNWRTKYVPIGKTTLEATLEPTGAEIWVKHKEDVPLPGYDRDQVPWDLRRQRIIFN